MTGTLTLIGSGEFLPGMVAVHRAVLARLSHPRPVFIDTPAGFQTNADELSQAARDFFQLELGLALDIVSLRRSDLPAEAIRTAKEKLAAANYLVAGPGSPTYALRHWRASSIAAALSQRLAEGAHLVFASSAAIALSRRALPVYEIYKVGADPFWADGLDLLGPHGFDLAIVPHWNNSAARCFVGLARFNQLAAQAAGAVILGLDEHTALTLDLDARTATVAGAGTLTIQYREHTHIVSAGTAFGLSFLTPAGAFASVIETTPVKTPPSRGAAPGRGTQPEPLHPPRSTGLYVPPQIHHWASQRDTLRASKDYAGADLLRKRIAAVGYSLQDSSSGPQFTRITHANSAAVPSQLDQPAAVEWSVTILSHNNAEEIVRAARSALRWSVEDPLSEAKGTGHTLEVVIADDASAEETVKALADFACEDERVRLVFLARPAAGGSHGEGAGRNASLRAARGQFVVILGGHMEIAGDIFTPLAAVLADDSVGATGSHPLVTADLFKFAPAPTPEADAIEFYLFAFRRERLKQVGWLDEKFVFYRNLDLDWSLAFKNKGLRLVAAPDLPLIVHEHPYPRLDPAERDRLSKKNYRRFLDKWRARKDLLAQSSVRRPAS